MIIDRLLARTCTVLAAFLVLGQLGCTSAGTTSPSPETAKLDTGAPPGEYLIGPGDMLRVFVWQNPDLSVTIPVRPDGRISIPLIQDLPAAEKTPTQLA